MQQIIPFITEIYKLYIFFFVQGAVGCVWFVFWALFVYETPADHPTISKKELKYFQMDNEEVPQKVMSRFIKIKF